MANKNAVPPKHSQFKKGKSGNPDGRPKEIPELKTLLAEVLSDIHTSTGKSNAEAILRSLMQKALKGDVRACEVLLERGWGKVMQQMNLSGTVGVTDLSESELDNKIQELLKSK